MISKSVQALLLLVLLSNGAAAQTSVIAFRSHSGNIYLFNPSKIADNLGWTGFERQTYVDTSLYLTVPGDTASGYPYCNNPAMTKDSLSKNYPFYTTTITDTTTTRPPAAEDTLAKPKEHIKSRSEVQKNELVPAVDFYGNPKNPASPGAVFIISLIVLMTIIGTLIWMFNRKKLVTA